MRRTRYGEGQLCKSQGLRASRLRSVGSWNSDYLDGIVEGRETNNGKDKEVCGSRIKMMVVYESAT